MNCSLITKSRAFNLIGGRGEYRLFSTLLVSYGFSHRLIFPHTHHQNGVVERKHRHIVDSGLTLLHHASLSLQFWDYAFTTTVNLINRLLTASLNFVVPFVTLFNKDLDYYFLKTFGFVCFPLLRSYHTHKLNFQSQECLFLGYSSSHKGYKCLSSSGRIYISKDVLFNELRFPSSSKPIKNLDSYFSLNPNLSPPSATSTPQSSQMSPSNSASIPLVPPSFSPIPAHSPITSMFVPHPSTSSEPTSIQP